MTSRDRRFFVARTLPAALVIYAVAAALLHRWPSGAAAGVVAVLL